MYICAHAELCVLLASNTQQDTTRCCSNTPQNHSLWILACQISTHKVPQRPGKLNAGWTTTHDSKVQHTPPGLITGTRQGGKLKHLLQGYRSTDGWKELTQTAHRQGVLQGGLLGGKLTPPIPGHPMNGLLSACACLNALAQPYAVCHLLDKVTVLCNAGHAIGSRCLADGNDGHIIGNGK